MLSPQLKALLDENPLLFRKGNLYYQVGVEINSAFEENYLEIRKSEGRLYNDAIASKLPWIDSAHPLSLEWRIRRKSAERLTQYLSRRKTESILEVGCGNGWLVRYIHQQLEIPCCGIDVNESELLQASRISIGNPDLLFVYGDIFSNAFRDLKVDVVVLASVIQYFNAPDDLVRRLRSMLNPAGQIHILDSPFYSHAEMAAAQSRSRRYFNERNASEMARHYFHHSWDALKSFAYSLAYDPRSISNRLSRQISSDSPFPSIIIEGE